MAEGIKSSLRPPLLDFTVDRYAAFKSWKTKWQDYVLLSGLKAKHEEFQAAMMRYTFSAETRNIYDSLNLSEAGSKKPARTMADMEDFAKGILNETLERHSSNSRKQEEGEKFDDFLTEIKLLSKNCKFYDACYPSLVRDRTVSGIFSDEVREKLLSEKDLTLEKAMEICRSKEKALRV